MTGKSAVRKKNTVFVLGAGFTKAFLPLSPMMTDDYDALGWLARRETFHLIGLQFPVERGGPDPKSSRSLRSVSPLGLQDGQNVVLFDGFEGTDGSFPQVW